MNVHQDLIVLLLRYLGIANNFLVVALLLKDLPLRLLLTQYYLFQISVSPLGQVTPYDSSGQYRANEKAAAALAQRSGKIFCPITDPSCANKILLLLKLNKYK